MVFFPFMDFSVAFPKKQHCETPVGDVSGDLSVALDVQGAVTLSCLAAGNTSSSFANSRGAWQLHYWLTWLFVFQVRPLEDQIFSTNITSAIPCVHLLCLTTLFWLHCTSVSQCKLWRGVPSDWSQEILRATFSYVCCSKFSWFFSCLIFFKSVDTSCFAPSETDSMILQQEVHDWQILTCGVHTLCHI